MLSRLKRILFPPVCAFCGAKCDNSYYCGHCELPFIPPAGLRHCGKCISHADGFFAPFFYQDSVKKAILALKMDGVRRNHIPLARFMCETIQSYGIPPIDFVTCIPLGLSSRIQRGFNQSQLIAVAIAARLHTPFEETLYCKKHKKHQKTLGARERFANIKGKFAVLNPVLVKDKNILLVDDVVTTGATVNEAAYMLKQAGAKQVFVVCAASTSRKAETNTNQS